MHIKFIQNNRYKDLFFILLLFNTLAAKLNGNALATKKKSKYSFLQLELFADKTTLNFHTCNKVNYFATTQSTAAMFYPFYLNPCS